MDKFKRFLLLLADHYYRLALHDCLRLGSLCPGGKNPTELDAADRGCKNPASEPRHGQVYQYFSGHRGPFDGEQGTSPGGLHA